MSRSTERRLLGRRAMVPLMLLATSGLAAACDGATSPSRSSNCDPGAGFNFTTPRSAVSYRIGETAILDLLIQRDTAQGQVHFDVLRGVRRYGSGIWQDSLGLNFMFTPNPVPPGGEQVRIAVSSVGHDLNTFTNESVYVRAFIGDATRAKECFRLLVVSVLPR